MELGLKGKSAIVTGSSRGIGAAIARSLGRAGAKVAVNYFRSRDMAETVAGEIAGSGGEAFAVKADVTMKDEVEAMTAETIKRFGKVDILVNNAAIGFPMKPFMDHSWDEVEAKMSGEMKGIFFTTQAAVRDMMKRKYGRIIHISSGLSRYASENFFTHAAAKAAMDSSARVMAKELGPMGITVNVIGPGLIPTDATAGFPKEMFDFIANSTPLKRIGAPDDIAGAVTFLASDMARFITGQYIHVNGGTFMP
ncbi:MAG: 3-oxoacyl-ACP reductase FabG [Deltaproteobacteria bacterium]|nr:3-oxoacyl-ACP reductase FabG [Deltaproteobacteria bacterium]